MSKRRKRIQIAVWVAVLIVAPYFIWMRVGPYMSGVDREYVEKMGSIRVGMTESEVVELLGEPSSIDYAEELSEISQSHGDTELYGVKIKNVNKCLRYSHGLDTIGHYFLDVDGKVYFVNVGGT